MLPEAILLQARAAMEQTNMASAIRLLSANVTKAGPLADQYLYRLATAHFQSSNYAAAVESFLRITSQYTNSPLLLEASYGEARARFKLREYGRVILSLQDSRGAFRQASRSRPTDVATLHGQLLLAEALLAEKEYRAAEAAAKDLAEDALTPEDRWDRQSLVCRILIADQRLPEALSQSTNLVTLAAATARRSLLADANALQADLLHLLGRLDDASQVYTNNLADTVPVDRRRMAMLNLIEIKLEQDNPTEAAQMLQSFVAGQPDNTSGFLLLTAGELQLKLHLRSLATNAATATATATAAAASPTANGSETNHLQTALAQFDQLLANYTNSPLRGKAFLDKGWCLWLDGRDAESVTAFSNATNTLPFGEDLAIARFKLADALYKQGDYTNAIRLYRSLTNDFAGLPRVRHDLFEPALFQVVRANIEGGDTEGASAAVRAMLSWAPTGEQSERGLWLVAQDRLRSRQPKDARQLLDEFLLRFPHRPLEPEIRLAIARTYQLEDEWPAALRVYEGWLVDHPNDPLRPNAEYYRALATERCGSTSNAFQLFTNMVATFPTHRLARQAQLWVAQEYLRLQNYREAASQFQLVAESTNWPIDRVTYEARMMAGRAAFAGQLWTTAGGRQGNFTLLINDLNCPEDILYQALIAAGDTKLAQDDADGSGPLDRYIEAKKLFEKVTQKRKDHPLAAYALGRIGDCYLQLASKDPEQYRNATNAYAEALRYASDVTTRSTAEYGWAHALKLQAAGKSAAEAVPLLKAALDHFLNILLGHNLGDGEEPDPVWRQNAGLDAARVAEELKQWNVAINIYERLQTSQPALRPRVQDRIAKAQEQLRAERERRGGNNL
jgi:TolA-binding protein